MAEPRCRKPWESVYVHVDGRVRFCCFMSGSLGDLRRRSLPNIWNDVPARAIRRDFLRGLIPPTCQDCPVCQSPTTPPAVS